jgi:asparagine synthase (glutamine-hydrolysing)
MDLTALLSELTHPHPRGFSRDTRRMFASGAAQAEIDAAMAARYGIETRDPTADRDLVEVAVTQPEWWRRNGGVGRKICRTAMRDLLPTEIVDRESLGAQQPEWFDRLTCGRAEVLDELDAMRSHPASCEVIDVAKLDRLAKAWPDRNDSADNQVIYDYQLALPRAIVVSRYLRWFEDRARRVRSGGPAVVVAARR